MSSNLPKNRVFDCLFKDDYEEDNFGSDTDEEKDECEVMSEGEKKSDSSDSNDTEVQKTTLHKHAIEILLRKTEPPVSILKGKNGYSWSIYIPKKSSDSNWSHKKIIPGPINEAAKCSEVHEYWETLFTEEIRKLIVNYTNLRIELVLNEIPKEGHIIQTYQHTTELMEINAFIGLLYYAGTWKANHVALRQLWAKEEGYNSFRCTMPLNRFTFLAKCLRFDDKSRRPQGNSFACVEEIWNIFIERCRSNYEAHESCSVGKILLEYQGRCPFRVHINSKPGKCGLKIVTLNDAQTSYLINAVFYKKKIQLEDELVPEYLLRKVTEPIHGTHRSVTCDNWFTTISIIEKMWKQPYGLPITGSIHSSTSEIPLEMKIAGKEQTAKFCYHDPITLISWTPKKNKIVLLASSYLQSTAIDSRNQQPSIINHYNMTKGGIDTFDQLCKVHSVARATRRWSVRFFFGMLDQAIVNSRILYICKNSTGGEIKDAKFSARKCHRQVALHLIKPWLYKRLDGTFFLRQGLRKGIEMILGIDQPAPRNNYRPMSEKRRRCGLCARKDDNKTRTLCSSCERPMCDQHRMHICNDCGGVE